MADFAGGSMIPRVSVLMMAFDQAHFIRRARDSLSVQTLTDWELIIVDDGSQNGMLAAIQPSLADIGGMTWAITK
jgi:spore maturation protein CgeD